MILAGIGSPAGVMSLRPDCSGCSACGCCTMSRQETLDSGTYQSELLMPGAEPLWGFGENLGEFTSVMPTPFLYEILVGTLRCHCWLTSMTVGKQRYGYRCETSEHFKAALRHFSAARKKELEMATECLRHGYDCNTLGKAIPCLRLQ